MLNNTQALRLARLVVSRWEESQDSRTTEYLNQKEPPDVQEARRLLQGAKLRWSVTPQSTIKEK